MDRLEAMALLIAVADKGSMSAAGRALQVPLATLSRKLSDLENGLGTRLLIRTTRKLTLTDAGIGYVAAARRILEDVEEAERAAAGEYQTPKGELIVTAPTMFGRLHVLPQVAEFLDAFPEISMRLVLADRNVDIIGDHVDMAIRIGKLADSSLVATQIGVMRLVTCASPALLAGRDAPQKPDDLMRFPCVDIETPMPWLPWHFRDPRSGTRIDVPVTSRLSLTTADAAIAAGLRGVGVVRMLYYQGFEAIQRQELHVLLESYEPEPAPVHLIHAARGQMPLKMRRFHDFAVPRLRDVLSAINAR